MPTFRCQNICSVVEQSWKKTYHSEIVLLEGENVLHLFCKFKKSNLPKPLIPRFASKTRENSLWSFMKTIPYNSTLIAQQKSLKSNKKNQVQQGYSMANKVNLL